LPQLTQAIPYILHERFQPAHSSTSYSSLVLGTLRVGPQGQALMINTDKIENGYTKSCWNLARTKARFALDGYTVRTDRWNVQRGAAFA
jgi:hypothetical protein